MNISQHFSDSPLPTADERKKVFHWIKRISSYTAWNRLLGFYRRWAAQMERCVAAEADKLQPGDTPQIGTAKLVAVLKGLSHCERAVERLHHGDKRIFESGSQGDLEVARRARSWWSQLQSEIDYNGYGFRTKDIPEWDALEDARADLEAAWTELGYWMIQPQETTDASNFFMGSHLRSELSLVQWPDSLSDVPLPVHEVLIRSGHVVPYSGIWEPVAVKWAGGFAGLFKKPEEPQDGHREIEGCMAYLYGDQIAQRRYDPDAGREGVPTTWRLVWRDDRYQDGSIPVEEEEYRFVMPEGRSRPKPAPELIAEGKWNEIVVARSGDSFDLTGRWAVKDDLNAWAEFYAGQVAPQHNGRDVEWLWCGRE